MQQKRSTHYRCSSLYPKMGFLLLFNKAPYQIGLSEILFFKADGAYTQIVLSNNQTITSSKGLKHYEELLGFLPAFFRCHKSYIVNVRHISEYIKADGGSLVVANNYPVALSTDKSEELMKRMGT